MTSYYYTTSKKYIFLGIATALRAIYITGLCQNFIPLKPALQNDIATIPIQSSAILTHLIFIPVDSLDLRLLQQLSQWEQMQTK